MPAAHIFSHIVDNLGDAGVSWVLATALAQDHGFEVTLFLDDLAPLEKLAPDYRKTLHIQVLPVEASLSGAPADLVVEVLAGRAPDTYIHKAAMRALKPVWIIYEYLSAETWVETYHLKPSPHPTLDLPRFFFYPGFTAKTGGLLYREYKNGDSKPLSSGPLQIGLFCYQGAPITSLVDILSKSPHPVTLRIPGGAPKIVSPNGSLTIKSIPFIPRDEFDAYLGENDINFVRGEESFTAAVLSGRPLVWNIYPQDDNAHQVKLDAFCALFTAPLPAGVARAFTAMNRAWNGLGDVAIAWPAYLAHLPAIAERAAAFAAEVRQHGSAAKNLVDFYQKFR